MTHYIEIYLNLFNFNCIVKEVAPLMDCGRIIQNEFQSLIGYSILINSSKNELPLKSSPFRSFQYFLSVIYLFLTNI